MGTGQNEKKTLAVGLALENKEFKKSMQETLRLINSFVKQMNKSLSKLGQIKPTGYTSIKQRVSSTNKDIKNTEAQLRTEKDLLKQFFLEEKINNLKRKQDRRKPVKSQKAVYKEGDKLVTETSDVAYAKIKVPDKYNPDLFDEIYQRERNVYKNIIDLNTGVQKRVTTTIRSIQEMTEAGPVWKDVSNVTTEKIVKFNEETEKFREKMNSATKPVEVLREQLKRVQESLAQQGLSQDKINTLTKKRLSLEKQIKKLEKPNERTPLSVVLKRFISVGTYRMIRNTLKELATGITDAFGAIAKISPEFNDRFSDITSSITMLKGSIGMVAASFVQVLAPAITVVAKVVGFLADGLSLVGAALSSNSKRMKVNLDYWKSYKDTLDGTLLSFDDFTTLSQQGEMSGLFEETDITWVEKILGIISAIGATTLFVWLTTGGMDKLKEGLKKVKEKLTGVKTTTGDISKNTTKVSDNTAKTAESAGKAETGFKKLYNSISPIYLIALGITEALNGWSQVFDDSVTGAKKVLAWITAIAGTVAVIAGVLAAFLPTGGAKIAKAISFSAVLAGGISSVFGTALPNQYANGGNFRTGDFFVANENGNTELIASSNSGGGSVMNLDQWAQVSEASYFNALVRYDAAQNSGNGGLDIDKLGVAIARSNGFRNEINRRNVSLNLR